MTSKRIGVVLPFFGTLPSYFTLWLISAKFNPTIDWLLFTDDRADFDYPENVKVHYTSFAEIKNRLQSIFEFKIKLDAPWGLCAFKPCYGEAFAEFLINYDFWGYCDCDLIFGNIRRFLTDDVLNEFDKILWLGHFSLIKNDRQLNKIYKEKTRSGEVLFRRAFEHGDVSCFDEVGLNDIFANNGYSIYQKVHFADFVHRSFRFNFIIEPEKFSNTENRVFSWCKGELMCHELHDDVIDQIEYLYIHFCRRPMFIEGEVAEMLRKQAFAIVPGKFVEFKAVDKSFIRKHTRFKIYWEYILPRLKPHALCRRFRLVALNVFGRSPITERPSPKYWLINGRR